MVDAKPCSHAGLAVWVALCMLLQSFLAVRHDVTMTAGLEVCTAEGAKRIKGPGEPGDGQHLQHACCVMGEWAAPPSGVDAPVVSLVAKAVAQTLPADWVSAQWFGPLSRGPPVLV